MTRKDYIALAQAISHSCNKLDMGGAVMSEINKDSALLMAQEITSQIGNVLAADNPNFDWARWMNACNTGA